MSNDASKLPADSGPAPRGRVQTPRTTCGTTSTANSATVIAPRLRLISKNARRVTSSSEMNARSRMLCIEPAVVNTHPRTYEVALYR